VAFVLAVVLIEVLLPLSARAGFGVLTAASHTISTGTLGPATAPAAARGDCVIAVSTSITLSWVTSALATGYTVMYGPTNGGPYGTSVTVAGGTTTSTNIALLAFSTTYYAVVVATVGGWTSSQTAQVSVTTQNVLCV